MIIRSIKELPFLHTHFVQYVNRKEREIGLLLFFVGLLCWLEFPSRTDESWHLCDFWQQFSHDVNQQKNLLLCAKDNPEEHFLRSRESTAEISCHFTNIMPFILVNDSH